MTLHTVKRLELEVLVEIERITGQPELAVEQVGPWQFHGIEVKPWAREIAELTLWIGFHQFWAENHGGVQPPEPVLRDTGTLELRDAVLAWDEIVHVPEKDRPDPTPRIPHPVTGKLVPDPEARLPYMEYRGARQAAWPRADFIVGNPPYMGGTRMREAFGDGYVDALRSVYPEIREGADFVMFWWFRAALSVQDGETVCAGLITTNSITQSRNRTVVEDLTGNEVRVIWAIADHPWIDEAGSASVRVAMTVLAARRNDASLVKVDGNGRVTSEITVRKLNSDLSAHADVASATDKPLTANLGMSFLGFLVNGPGFILSSDEGKRLIEIDETHREIIKPILNGRDLAGRSRNALVIDFGPREVHEAANYPVLYNIVIDRVKPRRDANKDRGIRENWWRFHRIRHELRGGLVGLARFIVTPETARRRFFVFLSANTAPDHSLVCIVSSSPSDLGVLSSTIHASWALSAGSRLGVGNDPRYNKTLCFDPFPFPDPAPTLRTAIGELAETLDTHRKAAIARDERVTMTGMYNIVEKLRSGEALTPAERTIHEIAACGVLRDLHDELDRLVAEAYGWTWPLTREQILDRLVALHDERVEEERRGIVRWLRPDYQIPRFAPDRDETHVIADAQAVRPGGASVETAAPTRDPWPARAIEQLAALQTALGTAALTAEEATSKFEGAPLDLVRHQLELLAGTGEAWRDSEGRYHRTEQTV